MSQSVKNFTWFNFCWVGDVAQLIERSSSMLPTQVRFASAARDFSFSHLSVQVLLQCPYIPVCSCMHLLLCTQRFYSPCYSMVEYRNAKTPSITKKEEKKERHIWDRFNDSVYFF